MVLTESRENASRRVFARLPLFADSNVFLADDTITRTAAHLAGSVSQTGSGLHSLPIPSTVTAASVPQVQMRVQQASWQ